MFIDGVENRLEVVLLNYHNITTDDMLNGDGLRTVLWVAGCNHHCKNCQNPITWDAKGGIPFDFEAELELFNKLQKAYISGITFSGGDPLYPENRETIFHLAKYIKKYIPNKTVWLYTGYLWEEICSLQGMKWIDILVDGRFDNCLADINYHWAGSTNQRVIDVQKSLDIGQVVLKGEM